MPAGLPPPRPRNNDKLSQTETYPLTNRSLHDAIVLHDGERIAVDRLLLDVHSLASRLPNKSFVINLAVDRYSFIVGFCAAVIRGQCTLMPPNRLDATLELIEQDYPDSYRLASSDRLFEHLSEDRSNQTAESVDIPLNQLCAIAFTSGSTGNPTPNQKFWRTLVVSIESTVRLLGLQNGGRLNLVATVPCQHMWGMETAVLLPLLAEATVNSRHPFFPKDVGNALAELPEPRALVTSPAHLEALIRSEIQLPSLDRIFSATAPISPDQARRLESRFATRLQEVFGCSETGIIAARETARETLWRVSDVLRIEPRDSDFMVVGDHLPASVVLPDVIELQGHDHFRWIGRHQDMVKVGGKRESLSDLNLRLLAIEGIEDGVIFMPGSDARRPTALVVSKQLRPVDVRAALARNVDAVFLPRPIFLVDRLPRQETGKIARNDLINIYEDMLRGDSRETK